VSGPPARSIVEFTRHSGDEFRRADGLSQEWTPG
jgi:hypothetical protein